jgi:hypothetical protein
MMHRLSPGTPPPVLSFTFHAFAPIYYKQFLAAGEKT